MPRGKKPVPLVQEFLDESGHLLCLRRSAEVQPMDQIWAKENLGVNCHLSTVHGKLV